MMSATISLAPAAPKKPSASVLLRRLDNLLTEVARVDRLLPAGEYDTAEADVIATYISMCITATYQAGRDARAFRTAPAYAALDAVGNALSEMASELEIWRDLTTDGDERAIIETMIARLDAHWAAESEA